MPRNIADLSERKAKIVAEARTILDSITDDATAEARADGERKFDAMMADADRIDADIRRAEQIEAAERALDQVAETRAGRENTLTDEARDRGEAEARAYIDWMRHGMAGVSDESRAVMSRLATRAQATGTTTAGGFLIPENFRRVLEEAKKAFGGIRPLATIIATSDGQSMLLPTVDDTANSGVGILAENAAAGEQDVTFGQGSIDTYMYHSGLVRVPMQLIEDSAFNLNSLLPRLLVERIARAENAHYATGTGTGQPTGFLTGLPTVETAGVGVVTFDDLIDLLHAVDPSYRMGAGWALSDGALKVIRKLKDNDGRPIWQESVRAGEPGQILGKPYAVVQEMPDVAAGTTPIAFGDFSKYIIRDAGTPIMQRLVERFAEYLQIAFHNAERHGGGLLNAGGNPLKKLTVKAA
jgi:HK97 family phage major capsid protein